MNLSVDKTEYKHQWYLANRERMRANDKLWYENNKEKAIAAASIWAKKNPERRSEILKKYFKANKQKYTDRARKYYLLPEHKEKHSARRAVSYALESGKLIKPNKCSTCHSKDRIEAHHHKGYSKEHRLSIIWLCDLCHTLIHKNKETIP